MQHKKKFKELYEFQTLLRSLGVTEGVAVSHFRDLALAGTVVQKGVSTSWRDPTPISARLQFSALNRLHIPKQL